MIVSQGQCSPQPVQTNTVQDTDDRIPKDSIYGTIRMKRREAASNEEMSRVEEDVDSLPPPPADDGYEDNRNPLLAAPKPAPRKGHNQDVLVSSNSYSNHSQTTFEPMDKCRRWLLQPNSSPLTMNDLLLCTYSALLLDFK